MTVRFSVDHWAAWAPGLADQASWGAWLRQPTAVTQADLPPLTEMPAMMRRRVERLGRVALQAAYWGQGDAPACPVVFSSRRGEVSRSVSLLRQLGTSEPLSPATFSMSVHNAIGALFSIASNQFGPYTAVAAGEETVEAAFTEALGQLADGEPSVLLVHYDEPLPDPLQAFEDWITFPRAMAFRLRRATAQGFTLLPGAAQPDDDGAEATALPPDLAVLNFLTTSEASSHHHRVGARRWTWNRHG